MIQNQRVLFRRAKFKSAAREISGVPISALHQLVTARGAAKNFKRSCFIAVVCGSKTGARAVFGVLFNAELISR
jgi:hypothetical protein